MQPPSSSSPLRPSSVGLVLAVCLALAGLYAVDRTLMASNQSQVEIEAAESAALVQGFLAVHAEALQSVRALYLDTTHAARAEHFHALVISMTPYATSFHRVWVTDTAGRITQQHVFAVGWPALPPGVDIDTVQALHVAEYAALARRTGRVQVAGPGTLFGTERGIVLIQPMYVGARFMGFAGGSITSRAILSSVQHARPQVRGRLAVLSERDTVAALPVELSTHPDVASASAALRLPGEGTWRVVVARRAAYARIRPLLWGIGLAALGALIVMLRHERRQGQRLTERSAELERLSTELLRANRAKSEFLANVSHELRTPLNAIVGFVELLRDGVYGELGSRQIAPVDRIASSAAHLRQVVDQVLDLAKMAAGRLEVHPEPVDLRAMILNVASEVEPLLAERGLAMSIDVEPSVPRIQTDPMHLRQILMNLIANAIKFTPAGTITVRTAVRSGDPLARPRPAGERAAGAESGDAAMQEWVALEVQDEGVGIAPADQERIFEEFEQVDAGPRGDSIQRGTGLGLAISRRLARLLGGDITVRSQRGKGSIFTVWLPMERAVPERPEPAIAAAALAGDGEGATGVGTSAEGGDAPSSALARG